MGTFPLRWRLCYCIYLGFTMSTFRITEARSVASTRSTDIRALSHTSCSDVNVALLSQSCNFNSGYCSFSHPTDHNDIPWRTTTTLLFSGVDSLHDGGPFIYPYMLGKTDGTSSSINTTTISGGAVCVQFWYAMTHSTSNLEVLVDTCTNGVETSLWNMTGKHGGGWNKATLAVSSRGPFKIRFKSVRMNFNSNLGVDDIKIWKYPSTETTIPTTKPTTTRRTTQTTNPNTTTISATTTTPTTTPTTTQTTTATPTPTAKYTTTITTITPSEISTTVRTTTLTKTLVTIPTTNTTGAEVTTHETTKPTTEQMSISSPKIAHNMTSSITLVQSTTPLMTKPRVTTDQSLEVTTTSTSSSKSVTTSGIKSSIPTKTPPRGLTTSGHTVQHITRGPAVTRTTPVGGIGKRNALNESSTSHSHQTQIIAGSVIGGCAVVLAAIIVIVKLRASKKSKSLYNISHVSATLYDHIPEHLKLKGMKALRS